MNLMTVGLAGMAAFVVAYLFGSIPTGYLAGKNLRGIDIRHHGSNSMGATNVLRTLGPLPALAVFLIDVLKGVAAVYCGRASFLWVDQVLSNPSASTVILVPWVVSLTGLAALLGHSLPVWLSFKGGKSIAAGFGVLLAMAWPIALGALACFVVTLVVCRIVSLGSILAALTAIALIYGLDQPMPYRLFVTVGGVYIIFLHRANVRRLLAGQEPRLGQQPSKS